jgi:hypothetical protein
MPEPITRAYASRAEADAAAAALKEAGYGEVAVFGGEADAMAQDAVGYAMRAAGVPPAAAATLAAGVAQGRSVVAVTPAFGRAMRAASILDDHAPIPGAAPDETGTAWAPGGSHAAALDVEPTAEATPFSHRLGWKVLSTSATPFSDWLSMKVLSDKPLPFASFWGWPSLSARRHMGWFGRQLLSAEPTPFSKMFGMRLLLDKATPLSSRFNLGLLTSGPTPFSTRFNLQLLTESRHPLSSRLGFKLLSDRRG